MDMVNELNYFSPEDFTGEFGKYLGYGKDKIYIYNEGEKYLNEQRAWIQVLYEKGDEVYNYKKPFGAKTNNVNIEFSASSEVIERAVDQVLIKRVITNILYNSIIHNDEDVSIEVKIEEEEDKVHILIIDNGKGIKEEDLAHIFERYYRGINTGARHKGSGLGMAIANDIVRVHGGTIDVKSQLGVGTEIEIIL